VSVMPLTIEKNRDMKLMARTDAKKLGMMIEVDTSWS